MNNSVQVLAEHAARSLPDSISERKRVLRALNNVLEDRHPAVRGLRAQLANIEAIERLNDQLKLNFSGGK